MTIKENTMQDYAREYMRISDEIKELEARKKTIREKFFSELGDGKNTFGKYTITTFHVTRPNVDAKAIKENCPDIYAVYGRPDIITDNVRVTAK